MYEGRRSDKGRTNKEREGRKTQIKTELRMKNIKYRDRGSTFMKKGKKWLRSLKNPSVDAYLEIHEAVENEIKKAEREIEEAGKRYDEVALLTGIKGIGVYSALIIYSEIEDGSRFPTEEKAFAFAGLVPRVHRSGNEKIAAIAAARKLLQVIYHMLKNKEAFLIEG